VGTADVVVIGGGCVGTSVLYHLAALGCPDAVLVEADALGAGSTSKAAGGIRVQHEDELNTRLVLRSLEEFTRFEELTGTPIDFKQVGYLFLLDNELDFTAFSRAAVTQQRLGIPTELLDASAVNGMVPGLETADLVGATYSPVEGYASPEAVVEGYAAAARRLGARVVVGTRAVEILTEADRVVGVRTDSGSISADVVVVAAGTGCAELTKPIGFDLPVHGEPRTIFYGGSSAGVPDSAPFVVDFATGFYFHREGPGLVFAGRESDLTELSVPATHRLPAIADVAIKTSWWGDYDVSPDHNAMIGTAPIRGLHYATGFSGHGFMQSPAVGEHIAQSILGMGTTLDLAPMSADRFGDGSGGAESFII
jgi:sarcosine oxidase subunit beta